MFPYFKALSLAVCAIFDALDEKTLQPDDRDVHVVSKNSLLLLTGSWLQLPNPVN